MKILKNPNNMLLFQSKHMKITKNLSNICLFKQNKYEKLKKSKMDRFVRSLATAKYPWSRNRPEVNFQKAALKGNGSHFFNFHFWIPGSLATTKYPWSRSRSEMNFQKASLKGNGSHFFNFHFGVFSFHISL